MKFSAVILAGGKSSRMGRDKAWLELDGQSLLARQIQLVRDIGACEVFISGRAGVDYSGFDCSVLQDRLVDAGPLGGIERALNETKSPFLLVLAVDMPRMTSQFVFKRLLGDSNRIGIVPCVKGRVEPLAALYPKIALDLIGSNTKGAGDESLAINRRATAFAEKCVERGLAQFVDVTEDETQFFANWNSPKDLE